MKNLVQKEIPYKITQKSLVSMLKHNRLLQKAEAKAKTALKFCLESLTYTRFHMSSEVHPMSYFQAENWRRQQIVHGYLLWQIVWWY